MKISLPDLMISLTVFMVSEKEENEVLAILSHGTAVLNHGMVGFHHYSAILSHGSAILNHGSRDFHHHSDILNHGSGDFHHCSAILNRSLVLLNQSMALLNQTLAGSSKSQKHQNSVFNKEIQNISSKAENKSKVCHNCCC